MSNMIFIVHVQSMQKISSCRFVTCVIIDISFMMFACYYYYGE